MGKAAKLKAIRKQVAQLPRVVTMSSTGGVNELINHSRQMKRLYNGSGMDAVEDYIQEVKRFSEQQKRNRSANKL